MTTNHLHDKSIPTVVVLLVMMMMVEMVMVMIGVDFVGDSCRLMIVFVVVLALLLFRS